MLKFKNKKILIVGSLGLIGFSLTKSLLKYGAKMILIDNNSKEKKKINFLKKNNQNLNLIDISDEGEVKNFFKKNIKNMSNLTSVVNLAGVDAKVESKSINFEKEFDNFDNDLIKKSIDVNLFGTLNICKEACKIF